MEKGMVNLPHPRIVSSYLRNRDTRHNALSFSKDEQVSEQHGAWLMESCMEGLRLFQAYLMQLVRDGLLEKIW